MKRPLAELDEYVHARFLAKQVLSTPHIDQDSDLAVLARQFLRLTERVEAIIPREH